MSEKCDKCGGWDCRGCWNAEELRVFNAQILAKAKLDIVSPIVSKPYVVPSKKSVELKVPRYLRATLKDACNEKKITRIMKKNAKLLQKDEE